MPWKAIRWDSFLFCASISYRLGLEKAAFQYWRSLLVTSVLRSFSRIYHSSKSNNDLSMLTVVIYLSSIVDVRGWVRPMNCLGTARHGRARLGQDKHQEIWLFKSFMTRHDRCTFVHVRFSITSTLSFIIDIDKVASGRQLSWTSRSQATCWSLEIQSSETTVCLCAHRINIRIVYSRSRHWTWVVTAVVTWVSIIWQLHWRSIECDTMPFRPRIGHCWFLLISDSEHAESQWK
jgi:hypothetical protein